MVEQGDRIDDIVNETDLPELSTVNSGISNFSSAFDGVNERKKNSSKEMSIVLIETDLKENTNQQIRESTIQPQQDAQIVQSKVTRKSKSKPKSDKIKVSSKNDDREYPISPEPQVSELSAEPSLTGNSSSGGESSALALEKQELNTKSQASVGLPQWKPRQR